MKTLSIPNRADLPSKATFETSPHVRAWLRRIEKDIRHGTLELDLPDGNRYTITGHESSAPVADIKIHSYRALRRLLLQGDLGFAEAYLAGDWSSDNLNELFAFGIANERKLGEFNSRWSLNRLLARVRHYLNNNSRSQAKRNIAYHYDLGNDFYTQWLDSSMTYSAGIFPSGDEANGIELQAAQHNKYARLANTLDIEDGDHVLEIGCGWGGFMQHVLENHAARVSGVSISKEQCAYANERLQNLPAGARGEVLFQDYRDLSGQYDKIASIEMFEAVGEKYWPVYASKLKQLLKPHGIAALQIITIDEKRFEKYRHSTDFIQRYIFPGGMLPSRTALKQLMQEHGLKVTDEYRFGRDYAETLRRWRVNFDAAWPDIEKLGFDARFKRMWHYYLAYCEVGFDHGAIDVVQIRVEHDS